MSSVTLKSLIDNGSLPVRVRYALEAVYDSLVKLPIEELMENNCEILCRHVPNFGRSSAQELTRAYDAMTSMETFEIKMRRVAKRSESCIDVWRASGLLDEADGETRDEALVALLDLLRHAAVERIKKAREAKA